MQLTVPLFVPGDRPDRFEKALHSGATAVILDLEDAVAPQIKAQARLLVVESLRSEVLRASAIVRVNAAGTAFFEDDLQALRAKPPTGIMLPKCESADHVRTVARALPQTAIIPIVESIGGLDNARDIAADPATVALAFGAYDLAAQLGNMPTWEPMASLRTLVLVAARAHQRLLIDAPFVVLNDEVGLIQEAERAVEFGFDGKLAIHPRHVPVLLEAFTPSDADVEHARRVLSAVESGGVAAVDGKMVDPPLVAAARRILARTAPGAEHV
jgi:citrate lyase subunit beta / citryl-CoA lyase